MSRVNLCKEPGAAGPVAERPTAHGRAGVCRSRCWRRAAQGPPGPWRRCRGRGRRGGSAQHRCCGPRGLSPEDAAVTEPRGPRLYGAYVPATGEGECADRSQCEACGTLL